MLTSFHIIVDSIIIVVGLSIGLSLLVLWLVRKVVSQEELSPHNEVSGFVYAAIGVIYAIILGFAIISEWEQYRDAEAIVLAEANALGDLYLIAAGLPEPSAEAIRQSVIGYASAVVDDEWPGMEEGTAPSDQVTAYIDDLWSVFYGMKLSTPAQEGLYAAALEQMDVLSNQRRDRMEQANSGLLGVIWGVMIGGAVVTVLFPCLFGVKNAVVHSLIIGTHAATLGLLLFLAHELNYPFQGDVRIPPDAFIRLIEQFGSAGNAQISSPAS